jgi:RNA polymerase sigma-70 factor (ECF subfamily)
MDANLTLVLPNQDLEANIKEESLALASGENRRPELISGELLERIAAGDQDAMRELYGRTSRIIFGLTRRILRDQDEAEEATHDIYMHVWRKVADYDAARGTPTSWLLMIARSRTIDRLRARRPCQYEQSVDDVPHALLSGGTSPEQSSMREQAARRLREALGQLPEQQRQVIEMAFFQGLTHHELAQRLGQPLGTVKTRIRSGIGRLRNLMCPLPQCSAAVAEMEL